MNSLEHTDPDGDALTITTRGAHTWITCTSGGSEVTVGPFATDAIAGALPADPMDGGVTAALIEQEVEREAQPSAAPSVGLLEAALKAAIDAEKTALEERDAETARADRWHSSWGIADRLRKDAEKRAALWKETTREHVGRARTALSYAGAVQLSRAVAAVTPCSCSTQRARADKAETNATYWENTSRAQTGALQRAQFRTEKAEKERDEARAERNDALRREKAEQDRAVRAERSRDLALARAERAECHDCVADAAVIREDRDKARRERDTLAERVRDLADSIREQQKMLDRMEQERDEAREDSAARAILIEAHQGAIEDMRAAEPHPHGPATEEAPTIAAFRTPDPNQVRVKVEHPAFGAYGQIVHLPNTTDEVAADLWVSFTPTEVLIEHPLIGRHARPLDIPVSDELVEQFQDAFQDLAQNGARPLSHLVKAGLRATLSRPKDRPVGAERFDPIVDAAIRGHSDITSPTVVHAIADALAEEGARAPEDGHTPACDHPVGYCVARDIYWGENPDNETDGAA